MVMWHHWLKLVGISCKLNKFNISLLERDKTIINFIDVLLTFNLKFDMSKTEMFFFHH